MEGIFIFEALLVLAILGYQFYVYRHNKAKIELIKNLFPSEEQLSVTETLLDHTAPIVASTQTSEQLWTALLAGKPFREFTPSNPAVKRIVAVENDLLHIETKGGPVPAYTIAREKFDKLVAGHNIYLVQGDPDALISSVSSGGKGSATIDLIEVRNPSETFSKIIKNTNEYLKRNKGAAADFDILKDVSERYSEALDAEVQSTVTTPLYIGLLGTFSGVIIGLSSLIWSGFTADEGNAAGSFITDQNIPSFLFGVMIAMAGSFCGLLLTLIGNHDLKNARSIRDRRQNDYYTFLQTHLLPKLNSDMAASLSNLKSVLDSFNKDFLDKVLGFRPIVDTLTENISTQKEFIEKLDKIGFTQMANANLQVFDKMKESEQLFKNFMQYQVALNESVQQGAELTHTISDVLGRLTSLQEGFDKVPGYLQKHDESIQRQVNFFGQHERELHDIGSRIEQYFDKAALRLTDLMEARLQHQERDAQNAYEKWQEHFRNLNEDNIYQRILDYMQPFENLNQQQERLNTNQQQLSGEIRQTNERLLQKIETDTAIQQQLLQQMQVLNMHMARSLEPGPLKAALGKIFGGVNSRR
ncbi:hypothetical protein JAO76_12035 [Pontibacter sp. BT310]|uniref:MotA/TolQ/ExbB proton channel domain-containing protein n=1 Tax=Pontibacter populi TaxID=890055 RepID=A0ABS6XCT1_9BACT|nr:MULTISPECIES: hypothetical protein [Pontibacter]MBJ6118929.1 hypothetical protein [Pontibacter sp. BT310]MBR0571357.1 hypothetical protein [Microvirga sp. STS03]MBW3365783.1 hypothetical protein [Pontibacter populi]